MFYVHLFWKRKRVSRQHSKKTSLKFDLLLDPFPRHWKTIMPICRRKQKTNYTRILHMHCDMRTYEWILNYICTLWKWNITCVIINCRRLTAILLVKLLFHMEALLLTWFTFTPPWISNHILNKVCDVITYPFTNFNGCTVWVWEWIRKRLGIDKKLHPAPYAITYLCWDFS